MSSSTPPTPVITQIDQFHTETVRVQFKVSGAPAMRQVWGEHVLRPDTLTLVFERSMGGEWTFHQTTISGEVHGPIYFRLADTRSREDAPDWAEPVIAAELDRLNTSGA
jgi:hypothetical protein